MLASFSSNDKEKLRKASILSLTWQMCPFGGKPAGVLLKGDSGPDAEEEARPTVCSMWRDMLSIEHVQISPDI